jgi:hypothetical protein
MSFDDDLDSIRARRILNRAAFRAKARRWFGFGAYVLAACVVLGSFSLSRGAPAPASARVEHVKKARPARGPVMIGWIRSDRTSA